MRVPIDSIPFGVDGFRALDKLVDDAAHGSEADGYYDKEVVILGHEAKVWCRSFSNRERKLG